MGWLDRVIGGTVGSVAGPIGGLLASGASKSTDLNETVNDLGAAVGSGVGDAAGNAWDVFSGERDWRRQLKLYGLENEREDNYYTRLMEGLREAGINPMMAGQLGSMPNDARTPSSHSAESWSKVAGMAGGILSGGVGAMKGLTELGLIKANTANQIANTASTVAHLPVGIAKDVALTALTNAQVPKAVADTALSVQHGKESRARTEQAGVRTSQMRSELPRFHAESKYYSRHGEHAVKADKIRNPWQNVQLVPKSERTGRFNFDESLSTGLRESIHSASSVLGAQAKRLAGKHRKIMSRGR